MLDRRSLAIGVLVVLVAMTHVIGAQGQGGAAQGAAAAPQGAQGNTAPQGAQENTAPQGRGAAPQGRGGGGQGRAGGFGRGPAFTPEPGAKDLKSVLYNWTW